jgi:amidase
MPLVNHAKPVQQADADAPFAFLEVTVAELSARMQAHTLDCQTLVAAYLARIEAIDRRGPRINAIIEVNSRALEEARELDAERVAQGPRGPLHGIPILLKDNIATADGLLTTAGSLALAGQRAARDAHLVTRLRAAGALILGKTNMSEWANFRSTRSTSGWSGRGGLTRNPYALDRNTSGSSSGTGAAIAANLAALGVGTETDGSIVSPASINGLVGIKPTLGLISRTGIIPISHSQDTAGPMTRSVADAALLLSVLAGPDPKDSATVGVRPRFDYGAALNRESLRGARIGVARNVFGDNELVRGVIERALRTLAAAGATLVDPVEIPNLDKYGDSELAVLLYEFKDGLNRYLPEFAPGAPVHDLTELIAWNRTHASEELAYFGQELLEKAEAKGDLSTPEYRDALANNGRYARVEGLDTALAEHKLDALVAPTGGPAWMTDFVNGDHSGASFSSPAAVAGYPHVTVPAGHIWGLPVGLSFVGPAFSEARLIGYAYAFEQASQARNAPQFLPTARRDD